MNGLPPGISPRKLTAEQAIEFVRTLVNAVNNSRNVPLQGHTAIEGTTITITFTPTDT